MQYQWLKWTRLWAVLSVMWLLAGQAMAEATQRNFAAVLKSGELRVGVTEYLPWSMRDANGDMIGAEVDIARRLAADMGVKPVLREYSWEALVPALQSGEIDLIAAGLPINPEMALQVAFSQPYRRSGIGLATNLKLTSSFKSLSELNAPDVAIAVMSGTPSAALAERLFNKAAIKRFANPEEAEKALLDGLVHAYVRGNPAPRFLALQHPRQIDVPLDRPLLESREGLAVRKGDPDFVNFLNAWIIARQDDAWLLSTDKYWFESLSWQKQVQP